LPGNKQAQGSIPGASPTEKMTAQKIITATAEYIARNPRRFPNQPAALNVFGNAADAWEADGARLERLPRFFSLRPDGKFDFPPINKLVASARKG
jgi:hypothetical protein